MKYGSPITKNITVIRECDLKWSSSEKNIVAHIIGSMVYNNNTITCEFDYVENQNTWYIDDVTG